MTALDLPLEATMTTQSDAVTDGVTPVVSRTPDGAVIRPLGPFSLAETRAFVSVWEPTSHLAPDPDEPLRLTAALDGTGEPVGFAVTQDDAGDVHVAVSGPSHADGQALERAVAQLARILSLDHDARTYPELGARMPAIGELMARRPGLRPTLFGSPYEAAVWGVLSARISVRQANRLHGRIAETHGQALQLAGEVRHAFPSPTELLAVTEVPGLAAEKLRRLHGIAEAALDGRLDVDRLRALGPVGARAALRELRGIGPFWAAGIWLRGCGVVDEFPAEEPRCRVALARAHGRADDADITDLIDELRPYRMWVALLLRVLS